jgi:hypothetical protein
LEVSGAEVARESIKRPSGLRDGAFFDPDGGMIRINERQAILNRPGESGDSEPWKGWSHVREFVEEVPGRAA